MSLPFPVQRIDLVIRNFFFHATNIYFCSWSLGAKKDFKQRKRIFMYTLYSHEFTQLVDRQFADSEKAQYKALKHVGQFNAITRTSNNSHFNILQFESSFQEEVRVVNFRDFNHTSFHFQLEGHSNARISCFGDALPMKQGEFNVMNCIDPISNFSFPKQKDYSYICLGINQQYLTSLLEQCGAEWQKIAKKLATDQPFTLFDKPKHFGSLLKQTLYAIIHPPVADSLISTYVPHKIEELILLILNESSLSQKRNTFPFSQRDVDLLHDLKIYLDDNFLKQHNLSGLARQAGINEFKLKKGFKILFNYSVFGYINHLRMQYSYKLLQARALPLGAIAALVGYQSDASFIRAFKNYYGYAPNKSKPLGNGCFQGL